MPALILYNSFKKDILDGQIDLDTNTIKAALVTSGYTPDIDAHDRWNDVSANEASGTGYTAGGVALANKTLTQDNPNDRGVFDADDAAWTGLSTSFRYVVLYKDTGTPSTSNLIGYLDYGAQTITAANLTIPWDAAGILRAA